MFCKNCGKEIMDEAVVCIHCGCSTQDKPAKKKDSSNIGMLLIGLLIPLAGLIIWAVCRDDQPDVAHAAGKGALIGVLVEIGMSILSAIVGFVCLVLYFLFVIVLMGGMIYI